MLMLSSTDDASPPRSVWLNGSALDGKDVCPCPNGSFSARPHISCTRTTFDNVIVALPTPSRADPLELTPARRSLGMEATPARPRGKQADYDDDALDRLADLLADRLAARLGVLASAQPEPLVDAAQIARLHGKTRSWVYEHAGELGAVRLGSGPRPRLAFSPVRVAAALEQVDNPAPVELPQVASPRRGRRPHTDRTPSGAELLRVRGPDSR
jgi:hypothetical protein